LKFLSGGVHPGTVSTTQGGGFVKDALVASEKNFICGNKNFQKSGFLFLKFRPKKIFFTVFYKSAFPPCVSIQ